jgi:2,5-diamino-6-(ribosylamino)-4(3H)-pyrimidinone 5'-phosphate reductase
LSTNIEKRLELINKILERLQAESLKGIPIVVEGKNDRNVLNKLGIIGDIVLAKTSGKNFLDVINEIEKKDKREIILLFDFDRRGKEWTKRLASSLERLKIKPNLLFWKKLLGLVGRSIKDIEGLASYVETLRINS